MRILAFAAAMTGMTFMPLQEPQPPAGTPSSPQAAPGEPLTAPLDSQEQASNDPAQPSDKPDPNENPQKASAPVQEAEAASSAVPAQLFHGTITHINSGYVTVSRTLVGKRPESRRFRILRTTKVHHKLHVRAKVTVRYKHLPDGDVALEIQIHPSYPQKS